MCTLLCLHLTLQTAHYHHHQTVAAFIALLIPSCDVHGHQCCLLSSRWTVA